MWFSYPNETNWYPIPCAQVSEIQRMNLVGRKPLGLENLMEITDAELTKPISINNDLERLDRKYHNKKKPNKKPNNPRPENQQQNKGPKPEPKPNVQPTNKAPQATEGAPNPERRNKKRKKNRNNQNRPEKPS
jgi:hypothetical protein